MPGLGLQKSGMQKACPSLGKLIMEWRSEERARAGGVGGTWASVVSAQDRDSNVAHQEVEKGLYQSEKRWEVLRTEKSNVQNWSRGAEGGIFALLVLGC